MASFKYISSSYLFSLFHTKLKIISLRNILSSIDNQRIACQVKNILKFNNTKNFFFTFEGNPYEN